MISSSRFLDPMWGAPEVWTCCGLHGQAQFALCFFFFGEGIRYSARDGTSSNEIEIHKPELEALIQERLESGAFTDVDHVLIDALKFASASQKPVTHKPKKNLVQFLLESPLPGSGLRLERPKDYLRQLNP